MPRTSDHLTSLGRIGWTFATVFLGLIPSLAFFAWVERNASLPQVALEVGWPWISLHDWPETALIAWDFSLFLVFGLIHTALAQLRSHRLLGAVLPPQSIRSFYIVVTGLSLVALMGLWQNTGVVLWVLPLPPLALQILSLALFWGSMAAAGWVMNRFDALEFLGFKQLYSSAEELARPSSAPRLDSSGIYAHIRHPIYAFTLLAFAATPFMTLDRMLLLGSVALYLAWAIPIEERKLITLFGDSYERYRRRVPAIIPLSWPRLHANPFNK
jgi:protein-S-isoprenylcysteine O-methyltransferase Ste14